MTTLTRPPAAVPKPRAPAAPGLHGKVLHGLKVIEISQMVAGPYTAKVLADMGADVLKIEPPLGGDQARRTGPFLNDTPHEEGSVLFLYLNTCKKSVQADWRTSLGAEIVQHLARDADVLIEDTPPGTMAKHGLDYATLGKLNPGLVMLSMTPFGQSGPFKDHSAYPLNTFHSGGEGYLTPVGSWLLEGLNERPPIKQGRYTGEYELALFAAVPTLAAVHFARSTGTGQHIDLSKQEALIGLNFLEFQPYLSAGAVPTRASRAFTMGGIMPCKDGYVEFCFHEEHQVQGMVRMLGNPAWASEPWFKDPVARNQYGARVNGYLRDWLNDYGKEEIFQKGQRSGCTVARYDSVPEVVASDQFKVREFFASVEHPVAGTHAYPTAAYRFAEEAFALGPAPLLGQHNEEVYLGRLGFSREELVQMRELGVI